MNSEQNSEGFAMPVRDEEAEMAAARKAMAGFSSPAAPKMSVEPVDANHERAQMARIARHYNVPVESLTREQVAGFYNDSWS